MSVDWREVVRRTVNLHNKEGVAVVPVDASQHRWVDRTGDIINLSKKTDETFSQTGKALSGKKIRTWLWRRRHTRMVNRPLAVLWTVYHEESDTSYLGIGAGTSKRIAESWDNG